MASPSFVRTNWLDEGSAVGVWATASGWPVLIVAAIMASLFLSSSCQIIRQALEERRHEISKQDVVS